MKKTKKSRVQRTPGGKTETAGSQAPGSEEVSMGFKAGRDLES